MTLAPKPSFPSGQLISYFYDSEILKDNFLGDPHVRHLTLYYPPGYRKTQHYPLLVDLAPYTNSGQGRCQWKSFGESIPHRLDRLIATGVLAPCVVAFPDSMTRYGGNQFVNSSVMGRWEDHIHDELVPFIETQASCGGKGRRACYGKSSGGYGALFFAFRRPGFWSAVACHSGDMAFDLTYLSGFPSALTHLSQFGGSLEAFLKDFESTQKPTSQQLMTLMLIFGMGASYDPDPGAPCGVRLPVEEETGELIPDRWARWQAFDPLVMIDSCGDSLKLLKGLYLDCGDQDQFHHHFAARRFVKKLQHYEIPHLYEEFSGDHFSIDHRLDRSLPFLLNSL